MTTLISVTGEGPLAYPRALPESLVYRSAWGYGLAMRVLYGRYYAARDAAVAAHIPDGASVLELCCGPGRLHERELRGRIGAYVALDASARAVARSRVVIAEPVRNLAASRVGAIARLASGASATAHGAQARRFDAESLR